MQATPRKPSHLPQSLSHQLNLYALAATASGVAAVALAPPAEAKIIYTPAHRVITPSTPYYYLFFGKNIPAFSIRAVSCTSSSFCVRGDISAFIGIRGRQTYYGKSLGNYVATGPSCNTWNGAGCALALEKGSQIPTAHSNQKAVIVQRKYGDQTYEGYWLPGTKNCYVGFQFRIKGKVHYGWARLSITPPHHPPRIEAVLTGYAYETIANKPIIAGQTEGRDVVTVEPTQPETIPATLGALALGRK